MNNLFKHWRNDLPASLVVFLVALPLCLGIGLASTSVEGVSGLPSVFAGLLSGIVGGIVVGAFSQSKIGVSGPAAGLITIILAALTTLGSYEAFLVAVVISGLLQVIAGFLGFGVLGNYFPSSVIKGMLAAIGITLILKEIPHSLGYDADFFVDSEFLQQNSPSIFSELFVAIKSLHVGAIIVSIISLAILILFERPFIKNKNIFKIVPGALVVVVLGVIINWLFQTISPDLYIGPKHLVQVPTGNENGDIFHFLKFPDFSYLTNPNVYIIAGTIALVGSLETLLSVEATDKLDPNKNRTPTNRELKAQGIGNIVAGMIGGLPITQVIVRSTANINTGGKSQLSTIIHGIFLLLSVLFIPRLLNLIPLASLAAILIMIGYKLARIDLFKFLYKKGWDQFIPFVATIVGVLLTDLLKGIGIGFAVAIFFILKKNYQNNYSLTISAKNSHKEIVMQLSEEVTFLNKASIVELLSNLEPNTKITIDGSRCMEIDLDVIEILDDYKNHTAQEKNIELKLINIPDYRKN